MSKQPTDFCPTCHQSVSKRKVPFVFCLATAAIKALRAAQKKGLNNVTIQEMGLNTIEYTRVNDLVRFGLLYRYEETPNGIYGVPIERIHAFMKGERTVAEFYLKDPVTREIELSAKRIYVHQVKKTQQIKDMYGETMTEYLSNDKF